MNLIQQRNANNKGRKTTQKNPEYERVMNKIHGINKTEKRRIAAGLTLDEERKAKRQQLILERSKLKSTLPTPGVARFYYVRYADD